MAAAKHNIILGRGEDYLVTLTIKNEDGTAVDLTDDDFKGQVRRGAGKPLVASFSFTITDAANGVVEIKLTDTETLKMDPNITYQYDIYRHIDGNGDIVRLLYGTIIAEGNVTDPTT